MGTTAGVGFSDQFDSGVAGVEAATAAMEAMARGGVTRCELALLFCSSKHDAAVILRGVRSVVGASAMMVGGGALGAITNTRLGYEGSQVGVAVIGGGGVRPRTFISGGLDVASEVEVGRVLGAQIREGRRGADAPLILMYEAVKRLTPSGPLLNMGTPLLEGIAETLGGWGPVVGAGLHGDLRWRPGVIFLDDRVETQSAVALSLEGAAMSEVVINNLRPMSTYHEITAAEGPAVLGIDGKPALEVIEQMVGPDLRWEDYPLTVTLGVNSGDKYGEFRPEDYANYLCVAVDRERRALIMSDTYLRAGTPVQLMRRHFDFADIRRRASEALAQARARSPFLALYIDCAGRAGSYVGTDREEAAEIQAAIGSEVPLLGIYCGSEIARVGGAVRRLNHVGILAFLSE